MQDVYIVAATRTAVGKAKGAFATTRPDDLLSAVLRAVMKPLNDFPLSMIDDVIIGCAMPEASQGMNVARIATLLADFPASVPAMTINRFCSSGLQAISLAANKIATNEAEVVIAGGVESMSFVPMGGFHFSANPRFFENKSYESIAFTMGITAEKVRQKWGITREEQDAFALRSHQHAIRAIQAGDFIDEITPIHAHRYVPDFQTERTLNVVNDITQDQGPRHDTSIEALAKLKPVFEVNGTVTAGNSSQMSDGAAALVLMNEKKLNEFKLTPIARLRSYAVKGVLPEYMGIGPAEAIPLALKRSNIPLSDLGWIELNEAFAAQALAVIKELNLPMDKVNPTGGAIALGHPLGATGAILATKVIHGLRRTSQRYGMVTMCIGTGMGAAGIFEAL